MSVKQMQQKYEASLSATAAVAKTRFLICSAESQKRQIGKRFNFIGCYI